MTAKGSPIGHINPHLLAPNDWKAMPKVAAAEPREKQPAPGPKKPRR